MEKKSYQTTDGGWDKAATTWVELKSHSARGFSVHAKHANKCIAGCYIALSISCHVWEEIKHI